MLRIKINNALKVAMKSRDKLTLGTIRLILSSIKDKDIAVRSDGNLEGISDSQILSLLQTMVKQRNESIRLYEDGGRIELADRERDEITIIRRFTPSQIEGGELKSIIQEAIKETAAQGPKDMGKIMRFLKQNYLGRIELSNASSIIREMLDG